MTRTERAGGAANGEFHLKWTPLGDGGLASSRMLPVFGSFFAVYGIFITLAVSEESRLKRGWDGACGKPASGG